jgi:hypothetical protein
MRKECLFYLIFRLSFSHCPPIKKLSVNLSIYLDNTEGDCKLAKPNYKSKKRQKEVARQEKKELKKQRKMDRKTDESEISQDQIQNTIENPGTS